MYSGRQLRESIVIQEKDIVVETKNYWALRTPKGYEVYKTGITHSVRCARIGFTGQEGLERAKQECLRREQLTN